MKVKFLEQKSSTSPDGRLHANYLKCDIGGTVLEYPVMCANLQDFNGSSKGGPLLSRYFECFFNEIGPKTPDITTRTRQGQIIKNFGAAVRRYKPLTTGATFYYDSVTVGEERRRAILDLQQRLGTTFLSDVEPDRYQDVRAFRAQLDHLDSIDTDQIKSPTISMYAPAELFEKKLESILDGKYARFNVEWGGRTRYFDRQVKLSEMLFDEKIICNVVSIIQKRDYGPPYRSNVMRQFSTGASSCGTGYAAFGGAGAQPGGRTAGGGAGKAPPGAFVLDEASWNYEERAGVSKDAANTLSHNTLSKIVRGSHSHIRRDTFFTELVPEGFRSELA